MTSLVENQYLLLLRAALKEGTPKPDRTGTGTRSVFGRQLRLDLQAGFPLLTTKRVFWRGVVEELLWMIRGETNVRSLQRRGVHIWDPWADEGGDLGPVYGAQWRSWPAQYPCPIERIDQLAKLLNDLHDDPNSRRHLISAWNVGELDGMNLAPCHLLFQFYVADGRLSCQVYQRSADLLIGVPVNLASYALLTHLVARHVGLQVGELIWVGGDCHLYDNHVEQAREQLNRTPRMLPTLRWQTEERDLFRLAELTQPELVELDDYDPHPTIKAKVAV